MKLSLDFSLYKGKTLLKQWWKEVKNHFIEVQNACNALDNELANEVKERTNDDNSLRQRIINEETIRSGTCTALERNLASEEEERKSADSSLSRQITEEIANRQSGDTMLENKLSKETADRKSAENGFDTRIKSLEKDVHTHANKSVLDKITESNISEWNSVGERITKNQLDAAISAETEERIKADNKNTAYGEFLYAIYQGVADEIKYMYSRFGLTVYDAGIFGVDQNGKHIDAGYFTEDVVQYTDCGNFNLPLEFDGGKY